jgi:mitosis inhibitor protein kinase SWE1
MLASSLQPQPHYSAFRAPRDSSNSPSCRSAYNNTTSPLLTPSPFRRQPPSIAIAEDSMFSNSPLRSPFPTSDDDAGLFFASPTIQPMRTPHRSALSARALNQGSPFSSTRAVLGTKRKPGPTGSPVKLLTPLTTTKGEFSFDRLAPLPAPSFSGKTPRSTAETENFLQRQTRTMTRLNLGDMDTDGMEDITESEDELGSDIRVDLFAAVRGSVPARKAEQDGEEVAEAISPDGHVTKRRARSRPVSAELMETTNSPSPFAPSVSVVVFRSNGSANSSIGRVTSHCATCLSQSGFQSGVTFHDSVPDPSGLALIAFLAFLLVRHWLAEPSSPCSHG